MPLRRGLPSVSEVTLFRIGNRSGLTLPDTRQNPTQPREPLNSSGFSKRRPRLCRTAPSPCPARRCSGWPVTRSKIDLANPASPASGSAGRTRCHPGIGTHAVVPENRSRTGVSRNRFVPAKERKANRFVERVAMPHVAVGRGATGVGHFNRFGSPVKPREPPLAGVRNTPFFSPVLPSSTVAMTSRPEYFSAAVRSDS